ncbi:MAG: class I SAM-dependent methyltransferase [Geobacteraceae bacterium]|nr:MAG: class I SAM-dependent methyltransferase [Geobacteraceae bacterium]
MSDQPYFPENEDEINRLEGKTDTQDVIDQARWAGLAPGMRILDVGCGPGITTATLAAAAQPGGTAVGIDRSAERIAYAQEKYASPNVEFVCRNFFHDLSDLGEFDFIWVRFVLEYFLEEAPVLVKHLAASLKPGGLLFLGDLDQNCMIHYGLPDRLERNMFMVAKCQMSNNNFDPYAGRKLTAHLVHAGLNDIRADIRAHHLVYGELSEFDRWNWWQKMELGARRSKCAFDDCSDGFEGFVSEFKEFFVKRDRFTYTPIVLACGKKPI